MLSLFSIAGLAQENRFFSYKSGSFDLVMEVMGQEMVTSTVFDDYGALQCAELEMMGQKVKTVMRDGKTYVVSPFFQEAPSEETVNYMDLSPEVIEKYGITMSGIESVDGKDCLVFSLKVKQQGMDADAKTWVWEGFPIRSETKVMGMTIVTRLKNLKLDIPVDPAVFEIPSE